MTIDELIRSKRDEILGIATRYGTRNVRLFGSAARGEARPGSDIDILVDWERGRSLLDHVALMQDLEYLLGVRVDVVTRDALHASIREEILAEARPL
ncbi:MAG: nucleotidyltransferase family protein [Chloroflexi bacterium]|nr:nucleotidyltransferase family protein [Chloroflexota bacterium]